MLLLFSYSYCNSNESIAEVSIQVYLAYKQKTAKAYLSCCVAAFESNMSTSTASHMIMPWGTAEVQWCCNDKLIFSARCKHCCCCHLEPKSCISFHLLYFYRLPICVQACVCVCMSTHPFLLPSFQYILTTHNFTSFLLHHSLTHSPNLTDSFCPVYLFSNIFTISFLMRKEFVNIYHAVCVFSLLKW